MGPTELRTVVIVPRASFDDVVAFYARLGLGVAETFEGGGGRGVLFDAGRATLEILDEDHAAFVDELEVGEPQQLANRIALRVESVDAAASGAIGDESVLSRPRDMPWGSTNVRVRTPDGGQLTLFSE